MYSSTFFIEKHSDFLDRNRMPSNLQQITPPSRLFWKNHLLFATTVLILKAGYAKTMYSITFSDEIMPVPKIRTGIINRHITNTAQYHKMIIASFFCGYAPIHSRKLSNSFMQIVRLIRHYISTVFFQFDLDMYNRSAFPENDYSINSSKLFLLVKNNFYIVKINDTIFTMQQSNSKFCLVNSQKLLDRLYVNLNNLYLIRCFLCFFFLFFQKATPFFWKMMYNIFF